MPKKQKRKITIHAVLNRKPLCRFTKDDPMKWPVGTYWVHPKTKRKNRVTCSKCKAKMKGL